MAKAQRKKILVVEDDPASLDFLTTLLTHSGYEVVVAESGEQALAQARQYFPDLVVSDITMPSMDGFELAQKIRITPGLSALPILFYSATYTEKQEQWLAEACGVSESINKPADPEVILAAIERVLQGPALPLKADPYLLAEEHARILSEKVASKVYELNEKHKKLAEEIEFRKRIENDLRNSEHQYRSLVDHLPLGAFSYDLERNRFETVNPALVKMLGYSAPAPLLTGDFLSSVFSSHQDWEAVIGQIRARDGEGRKEVYWKRNDGSPILVRLSGYYSEDRKHIYAIAEDITVQRNLEVQANQSQRLEVLGTLAGGMAHDFNNMLMVIGGYCDLLLRGPWSDARQHRYAEQIKKAALSSGGLTRQLLAFSRKRTSALEVLDLNAVVTGLGDMLGHVLDRRIDLAIQTETPDARLEADRNLIEQVIVNLAVNASDAMPQGGSLRIETFATSLGHQNDADLAPGRYIGLRVTDTGEGIAPEVRKKLFEPFFTTKGEQGTGLGLATVARIMKQYKGGVQVESTVGEGSTFTLLFPPATESSMPHEAEPQPQALAGRESILLVDDEATIRMTLLEYLSAMGYTVLQSASSSEALQMIQSGKGHVDLMVTDVTLPMMSGLDLAARVRELQPGLPVLFISGLADASFDQALTSLPPDMAYVPKPFSMAVLAGSVRTLLDYRGPGPQVNIQ